jgi:hypothetical protein
MGFTLIELLVIVAIISVLLMLLTPSLEQAQALGRRTVCASNLRQLAMGLELYAQQYDVYVSGERLEWHSVGWQRALIRARVLELKPEDYGSGEIGELKCPETYGLHVRNKYVINAHLRTWKGWGKGWGHKAASVFRAEVPPSVHVMAHDGYSCWGWDQPNANKVPREQSKWGSDNTMVCPKRHFYIHGADKFYGPTESGGQGAFRRLHPVGETLGSTMSFNDQHVELIEDVGSSDAYYDDPRTEWVPH